MAMCISCNVCSGRERRNDANLTMFALCERKFGFVLRRFAVIYAP
ncbi:hypothetical protein HMPREF9080_01670 [Cardiobacterium valvarum F0432]|uniref:Uncharacterized protein n=1 Tax=Cardiobacterium valvarum F0432 TaxID=797473 RepID=G9ZFV7_9GAMM|nr:hypothetical protein HMPREF9080_01670 [Cardiobacterium valvarum F0432]